jgi:hypothetical protein
MPQLRFGRWALALAAALASGDAGAVSVSFGDSLAYWSGYANGTSDDGKDTIRHPDLTGGTATFHRGLLASIEIDYLGPFSLVASGPGSVIPGDLFIDAGADGDWDYVMKLVAGPQSAANYASLSILDVDGELASYLTSGADHAGHWQGYLVRNDHPYAWNGGGSEIGTGSLSAPSLLAGGSQSLELDLGPGLHVGHQFVLAFAASCANDVLFEVIDVPVPEPGTGLLLAVGLAAVARIPRPRRSRTS